jgi:hypothetical protein
VPTLYEAVSANFREVEKTLTQLERSINSSVRSGDSSTVAALTRAQALLVSIKAEARIIKIAFMPGGLTEAERNSVLAAETALDRWERIVDRAFRRHYKIRPSKRIEDLLDHTPLAMYTTVTSLIQNELSLIISMRNKLAHGQWVHPLNTDLTAVEPSLVAVMRDENTLSLRFRDNLLQELGNAVVDLVKSGPGFEKQFDRRFLSIRDNRRRLQDIDAQYEKWVERQKANRARLQRVVASEGSY